MARPRNTEEQNAAARERRRASAARYRNKLVNKERQKIYDRKSYLKNGKPHMKPEDVGKNGVSKPKTWADRYALRATTGVLIMAFDTVVKILENADRKKAEAKKRSYYALPSPDPQMLIAFIKTNLYESLIKLEILANADLYKPKSPPKRKRKTKVKRKRPRKSADKTGKSYRGRPPAKKAARVESDEGASGA